jgi:hypothetical protein
LPGCYSSPSAADFFARAFNIAGTGALPIASFQRIALSFSTACSMAG